MIIEIIDLNDEDADVTWGGKRTRYLYTLECTDLISDTNDSDVTESVHSVQSKTTSNIFKQNILSFFSTVRIPILWVRLV